jgi:protein-S-isoprenylcysteine O-methyltransferase Ste14
MAMTRTPSLPGEIMTPPKLLPPHYFAGAVIAIAVLAVVDTTSLLPGSWYLVGSIPIALGAALALWGSKLFANAGTNIIPFTESTALVTSGAFSFSRNPMYLGMNLALIGLALLVNAVSPWLVVVGFALLLRNRFVKVEEQLMEATFGEEYRNYKARVRRWI